MKTKIKLSLAGVLLASVVSMNAQTITVTSGVTPTATTADASTSVRVGSLAGNGTLSTGGANSFIGYEAGKVNTTGSNNLFEGYRTGKANTSGSNNAFIGSVSGMNNTTGGDNLFAGWGSGINNSTGSYNSFVGRSSGNSNTTATYNSFFGALAGNLNTTGPNNVFLGFGAAAKNIAGGNNVISGFGSGGNFNGWYNSMYGYMAGNQTLGDSNTFFGAMAGLNAGSGNVMLGYNSGANAGNVNNQLFIENSDTNTPLIWGDFAADQLKFNAKVGIGAVTTFPTTAGTVNVSNYKLFVTGGILTDEVRINLSSGGTWADYVFAKEYILKPLSEVEAFIIKNNHLPNVPSEQQIKEEGIALGEMAKIQQEKIEELTLYLIQQNKEIEELKAQVKAFMATKQ